MAIVDNIVRKEITGVSGMEVLRCMATGATSSFTSKFGNVTAFVVYDETTGGTATTSISGNTLTITATNDDYLDIVIFGR